MLFCYWVVQYDIQFVHLEINGRSSLHIQTFLYTKPTD